MNTESNVQNETIDVEYCQDNNKNLGSTPQELRGSPSLSKGLMSGIAAAIIGAVLWAMITKATGYQIGWMAVGVGYLVGYAVRIAGKGITISFAITGAILALLGCILGNIFTIYIYISNKFGIPVTSVFLIIDFATVLRMLTKTFNPMDLLFYAIAIVEGFRFSTIPKKSETSVESVD